MNAEPGRPEGRQKRRRRTRPAAAPADGAGPGPDAPYWLPAGLFWDKLAPQLKQAVHEVLQPAYRRLVLQAADELERSAGITLVHLLWLEICDQLRMANAVADSDDFIASLEDRDQRILQYLQLAAAKNATAELLMRLRGLREVIRRNPPPLALASDDPPPDGVPLAPPMLCVSEIGESLSPANDLPSPGSTGQARGTQA